MRILLYLLGGFVVMALIIAIWFFRQPATELVDATGHELTAGGTPEGNGEVFSGALFEHARALIAAREFAAAKEKLVEILETSERDGEACILLSDVTRELKEVDAAVDYGSKAVALLPDSAEAHLAYARALGTELAGHMGSVSGMFRAMKRVGIFKESLKRVIELDPDDTEARMMLMFTHMAPRPIGNIDRALELAEEIEARDPVKGKHFLAICYKQKKEIERAIDLCLAGIKDYPEEMGFHTTLASIYVEQERFEEADAHFDAARKGEKDEVYYRSLYYQGLMRVNHKFDQARAVTLFDEYIAGEPYGAAMPSVAHACLRKGNALEQLNRIEEAREAYEHSLRLKPGFKLAEDALEDLQQ
jgi:tetratricopeptide (TPR) repeat protein